MMKIGKDDEFLVKSHTGMGEPVDFVVAKWFAFVLAGHGTKIINDLRG
jgi:hypothetical protein